MWRRCFSQAWVQWTRALAAALMGVMVPAAFAFAVELPADFPPPDLPPAPSAWERAFTVKAGVGYKDNLTLAPEPRESSPFFASTVSLVGGGSVNYRNKN